MPSRPTLCLRRASGGGALIELTKGQFAVVDECDLSLVADYTWRATLSRHGKTFWAASNFWCTDEDGKPQSKTRWMHRMIMGVHDSNVVVDHRDGDGLNNRRDNLRACTVAQNSVNARKRDGTLVAFKGVTLAGNQKKLRYVASIKRNGRRLFLGGFASAEEAAHAYDVAALRAYGEFAKLNFTRRDDARV